MAWQNNGKGRIQDRRVNTAKRLLNQIKKFEDIGNKTEKLELAREELKNLERKIGPLSFLNG